MAVAFLIAIIFFLPLKFEVKYTRKDHDDLLLVNFFLSSKWQLYRLKIPKLNLSISNLNETLLDLDVTMSGIATPATERDVEIKKPFDYIKSIYQQLRKGFRFLKANLKPIKKITDKFYKTIHCQQISWSTEIGYQDAAVTALVTGFIWFLKNWIYTNMKQNVHVSDKVPNFLVKPAFNKTCFNTNLLCIFKIRLGHIIITGIKFIVLLASFVVKGGDQSDKSSN